MAGKNYYDVTDWNSADNTVAEGALSGTEGSQKTDGPTAGTIPGIP